MPVLHMDTDAVGGVAQGVASLAGLVNEEGNTMRQAAWRLVNSWQGGAAADFEWEVNRLLNTLSRLEEEAIILGQRLRREVEEWEDVDRQLSGNSGSFAPAWFPSLSPSRPGPGFVPNDPRLPQPVFPGEKPTFTPLPDILGKSDAATRVEPFIGTVTPPIIPPDHPASSPTDKPQPATPVSEKPTMDSQTGTVTPPIIPPDHPAASNPTNKPAVSPVSEKPDVKIGPMHTMDPIVATDSAARSGFAPSTDDKPIADQKKDSDPTQSY